MLDRMNSNAGRMKEKCGRKGRYEKDENDGTAARTRPWSFDEIMSRRKDKKVMVEDVNDFMEATIVSNTFLPSKKKQKSAFRHGDSEKEDGLLMDDPPSSLKHYPEDTSRLKSRKKEEKYSSTPCKSSKKGHHDIKDKARRKLVDHVPRKARNGTTEKQAIRRKSEQVHGNYGNETVKKHSRRLPSRDGVSGGNKRNSDREIKRDHYTGSYDNIDNCTGKKHDPSWLKNAKFPEKKENRGSTSHHEELRQRKRQSRSREEYKLRERSTSLSPSTVKRASYHQQLDGKYVSNKLVARHCSEIDGSKLPSNGSSSHDDRHRAHAGRSPRRKRREIVARTPSPSKFLSGKQTAGCALPPEGTECVNSTDIISDLQSQNERVSLDTHDLRAAVSVGSAPTSSVPAMLSNILPSNILMSLRNASVDSIQLTQATRPMRRLYVENVPASVSEKVLMEAFNTFLLSSGANHIIGTQPCISCIIHKEKGQAFVEFLTPEDASAALSFDGKSLSDSVIVVRRPKDFVEGATGVPEKSSALSDAISDIVMDSPNKIFIAGISELLSPKMLMEIVSAFGSLKAFRFHKGHGFNRPCAFVEYVDQSVSHRACAGLNGLKVGGQVLVVLQSCPSSLPKDMAVSPLYGIPEHANPLLEKPTEVLRLKNLFNKELLLVMTPAEVEETLEDVRLECSRFGTVRSMNVVKYEKQDEMTMKSNGSSLHGSPEMQNDAMASCPTDPEETSRTMEEACGDAESDGLRDRCGSNGEADVEDEDVSEAGSVVVEYRRIEGSRSAAHCFHGRMFDDRVVTVDYVPVDVYRKMFSCRGNVNGDVLRD